MTFALLGLMSALCGSARAESPEAVSLPPVPEPREALETQCPKNIALVPGRPVPSALLAPDGTVACGAIAVPTSYYAELLDSETAYDHLRTWTKLELTKSAVLLQASQRETEWWKAEASKPVPWHDRPWYNQALGAGTILASAVALQLATNPDLWSR